MLEILRDSVNLMTFLLGQLSSKIEPGNKFPMKYCCSFYFQFPFMAQPHMSKDID